MARLLKMHNGEVLEEYPVNKSELRIGRAADNDIILYDETVSSHHAILTVDFKSAKGGVDEYHIRDLQSTNKTYVNNSVISEKTLQDKDVLRVGLSHFEFDLTNSAQMQKEFEKTTKLHKSWIPGVFYTKDK